MLLSGKNQSALESNICNSFNLKNINFIKTSNLSIEKIITYLKRTKIYFGNDTGFSHLSAGYQIPSMVIYGDCEPFNDYSKFIYPIVPKDKIFTLDDPLSILGSKSSKKMQDGRLHQVLSHLIKTTVPLKDWEQLYKKFVHPAGFYLHAEAQLYTNPTYKPVGVLSDATPLNLRIETDSALPKLAIDTRIISKTDMGNSDILIMDGHKEYVCGSNTRRFQYANILDYADSEGWFIEDSYGRALEGPGLSVKNSVDAGLYSNKEIHVR